MRVAPSRETAFSRFMAVHQTADAVAIVHAVRGRGIRLPMAGVATVGTFGKGLKINCVNGL